METKTVHIPITDVEWIKFKIRCLREGTTVQAEIKKMILEEIKEPGPAKLTV